MTEIGKYIKKARMDKCYSIRKLGRLSGVNNSEISKIESGKRKNPKLRIIKKLCRYLDISYEDCLYVMELGGFYTSSNNTIINYYKTLDSNLIKITYKNIIGQIKQNDKILSYLNKQLLETDNKDLLIDTIKSYEHNNKTNKAIKEVLEETILNEYLNN